MTANQRQPCTETFFEERIQAVAGKFDYFFFCARNRYRRKEKGDDMLVVIATIYVAELQFSQSEVACK